MALHIGSLTADITVLDGEMPLSERQLCQVAEAVLRLIATRQREEKRQHAATHIMRSAQPPSSVQG